MNTLPPPALRTTGGLVLAPLDYPPLRVLIVDDNVDAADSLGTLLRMVGFVTRVCHGADAALACYDEVAPEACVLDVTMPGMDGCELARRLRELARGTPLLLVAVTALTGKASTERTTEAGFDRHLAKPADPQTLVDALFAFERRLRTGEIGELRASGG